MELTRDPVCVCVVGLAEAGGSWRSYAKFQIQHSGPILVVCNILFFSLFPVSYFFTALVFLSFLF